VGENKRIRKRRRRRRRNLVRGGAMARS